MKCRHKRTTTQADFAFKGAVFTPGETLENPKAHGHITRRELCLDCDLERLWAINGWEHETSAWKPRTDTWRSNRSQEGSASIVVIALLCIIALCQCVQCAGS